MFRPQMTLGIAVLACGSLILTAIAADPRKPVEPAKAQAEPTPVAEPKPVEAVAPVAKEEAPLEDKGPWEVTDQVELVYRSKIDVAGAKTLSAKVTLKNKSEEDIAGKLVLVIDGCSVPGTKLRDPNGQFTEATPYLQIVPAKRKLPAGDESPVKSVILESETPTKELALESPVLRWRAYTLTKPAHLDDGISKDEKLVPGKGYTWGEMRRIIAIQDLATAQLVTKHGEAIVGTGTSEDADGKLVIRVFAARGGLSRQLPGSIEGVPVELTVTGTIKAGPAFSQVRYQDGKAIAPEALTPEATTGPTGGVKSSVSPLATPNTDPTLRFDRPVPIGVSVFNQNGGTGAGTLGCRCIDRIGNQYVLSNNHVLANTNLGVKNSDPVTQPAGGGSPNVIGNLSDFQPLRFFDGTPANYPTAPINIMDAAVALCPAGMVGVQTPPLLVGYGTPSRSLEENLFVGMKVQKFGRTSSLTKGQITAINVEAVVNYQSMQYARFRNCIDVQIPGRASSFGKAGDSGSLVVTQADRRPIAILFAGGGFDTFLNPISPILTRFKVGVDDGTGGVPIIGSGRMGNAIGTPPPKGQSVNALSK